MRVDCAGVAGPFDRHTVDALVAVGAGADVVGTALLGLRHPVRVREQRPRHSDHVRLTRSEPRLRLRNIRQGDLSGFESFFCLAELLFQNHHMILLKL